MFEEGAVGRAGEVQVLERCVFIYPKAEAWELRVTHHGGPHWVRQAALALEIEEFALQVLISSQRRDPPSGEWSEADHEVPHA